MKNLKKKLLSHLAREEGHAYAYGGGGLITVIVIVLLIILIF
jgi:hypothetical protein